MTIQEFSDLFDILYNNITSNLAPGLDEYEKSVFLTKAQDEILKSYINALDNKVHQGIDDTLIRQVDFSVITRVFTATDHTYIYTASGHKDGSGNNTYTRTDVVASQTVNISYSPAYDSDGIIIEGEYVLTRNLATAFGDALFDKRNNSRSMALPSDMFIILNEEAKVTRKMNLPNDKGKINMTSTNVILLGIPISYIEYQRSTAKAFKRPVKWLCWRVINNEGSSNRADIIIGPGDDLTSYTIRYIKKPCPIILENLSGVTIDGKSIATECELDTILHNEILLRAVELAKAAYMDMNQQGVLVALSYALGLSATNMGYVTNNK